MQKEVVTIKNKIQQYRKERKLSQAELADMLGVTRQTIISIENERYTASLVLAWKISQLFDTTIEDVFDFTTIDDTVL